jgi:hypothetical protein
MWASGQSNGLQDRTDDEQVRNRLKNAPYEQILAYGRLGGKSALALVFWCSARAIVRLSTQQGSIVQIIDNSQGQRLLMYTLEFPGVHAGAGC